MDHRDVQGRTLRGMPLRRSRGIELGTASQGRAGNPKGESAHELCSLSLGVVWLGKTRGTRCATCSADSERERKRGGLGNSRGHRYTPPLWAESGTLLSVE